MNSLNFALMMIKSPHNTFKRYTELPTAGRKKTHQMVHRVPESYKSNLDMGQVNIGSPSWLSRWFVIFPMENQLFGESIRNYFWGSLWASPRLNWSSKITGCFDMEAIGPDWQQQNMAQTTGCLVENTCIVWFEWGYLPINKQPGI